jgi:ketosteroid isomerase-like protein
MAHPNEDLVREAFAAFNRGDMDALQKQYWAEDIRWHIPGRGPLAGDREGIEQVMQGFAQLAELTGGTGSAELHDVLANDEHAVALFTLSTERAGKQRTGNWVQVVHMRDGKVTESWLHPADQYAEDEFLS